MEALQFEQARARVIAEVLEKRVHPPLQTVPLLTAAGRVLAMELLADRDYPPLSRSVRDGFAVRSAELPGTFQIAGEIRAGETADLTVEAGQTVEIMTGAPIPDGADAVVMVEHCSVNGATMTTDRKLASGGNISPRGCEAQAGETLLEAGSRLGFTQIALLASAGRTNVAVYRAMRVAILSTGDEVVDIHDEPKAHQVRNSNAYALAAQVARAGGAPEMLPVAADTYEAVRAGIEGGLQSDLLLLSGGVSAGKYDLVERVLGEMGAEFFFDRVLIQPGQPLVFGSVQGRFFFGLPGNPASTMVTFELFGKAALELLGGQKETSLPLLSARLSESFRQKPGLTRFLPARLNLDGSEVTPSGWKGSGDVPALARANAFLVTEAGREEWSAGEFIRVLPQ